MWLTLAFTSAALLGFYDAAKKKALTGNAVLPVLLLNTLFSTLFFLPAILSAEFGLGWFDHTLLATAPGTWEAHALVVLKSAIVLTSWIFGYFGMKHLPITIVGPINTSAITPRLVPFRKPIFISFTSSDSFFRAVRSSSISTRMVTASD